MAKPKPQDKQRPAKTQTKPKKGTPLLEQPWVLQGAENVKNYRRGRTIGLAAGNIVLLVVAALVILGFCSGK